MIAKGVRNLSLGACAAVAIATAIHFAAPTRGPETLRETEQVSTRKGSTPWIFAAAADTQQNVQERSPTQQPRQLANANADPPDGLASAASGTSARVESDAPPIRAWDLQTADKTLPTEDGAILSPQAPTTTPADPGPSPSAESDVPPSEDLQLQTFAGGLPAEDVAAFSPEAPIDELLKWFAHPDERFQIAALEAIATHGEDEQTWEILSNALEDPRPSIRRLTLTQLAQLVPVWPDSAMLILASLDDPDPSVRNLGAILYEELEQQGLVAMRSAADGAISDRR
jgi:hypothetical protein